MNPVPETAAGPLAEIREVSLQQRRRVSEVRAREHVGAAGWEQTSMLEAIIRAGREGLAATDALRQVVTLTTEQLRALPLNVSPEVRGGQVAALLHIRESGEVQATAAEALDTLVCEALESVARTPMNEVSLGRLQAIHRHVREQVGALETIMQAAQVQADTLAQVQRLEQVSAEYQERVSSLRHLSAADEAQALGRAGEQLVERIAQLDEAAPEQVNALTRIGEAVADRLTETGASGREQAQALEELAQLMEEKAEEVRQG
ncbi:hypothetical protein [Deinococcus depolymerans]|uniref:Uncharacterized protein n=1 Tax=Deinococcus depolymerans TaxID=392408 RepID=A0ABP3MD61_9DEIO